MSRFERKILFAIGLSVFLTLGGSIFLAGGAVREVYRVGVNERFGAELVRGVEARRGQIMALRSGSEQVADAVEWAVAAEVTARRNTSRIEGRLQELLQRYDLVRGIRVTDEANAEIARVSREPDPSGAVMRTTTRDRDVDAGGMKLRVAVEVAVPEAYFERLQDAGEVADVYSRLQRQSASVSDIYVWVFGIMAFLVIVVAFLIGAIVSRRVTRRVTALAEASRQVGAGDLTVTLPTGSNDEVTELTQAFNDMVRDLRDSRARIEYMQRISAWQDFARRLAHEIKNPLTPIQLAAQELDETYDGENEAYRKKLEHARAIIEEEVATLRRLVGEFSSFAKLPRADLSPSDLCDLAHGIQDAVPAILEDVGRGTPAPVEVRVTCATEPIRVRMDPMMLKRGVDNLLRNAIQSVYEAHPSGGGEVLVRAYRTEASGVIEVRDNGPGISRENWDRVFDPYYTTKTEGTGLGLAIVKKVVLEHGGQVRLDRAPEGGARFSIELPLMDSP
ncbi:MAG: HAMP domain-containing protein [Deltaproteobacteria bacterium]|nr:HAMP domain-containing protein [Deltaproteobacteria bacterium]MBW1874123.1 HAMP domain-containing protein [Deltaproteobacteria bacterium]MBW2209695.1 HAMP domain-containing protein [Deltaproteobacteria bacterium]MBW2212871.1 HAMP domain-containing protein [Deltaproteobacteria bacterium]MBW2549729.1 HAMP domain-containing protein [Deltaproteobacteria bacterium]